jgi:hypothetical protein
MRPLSGARACPRRLGWRSWLRWHFLLLDHVSRKANDPSFVLCRKRFGRFLKKVGPTAARFSLKF